MTSYRDLRSLAEVETQTFLSRELGYMTRGAAKDLLSASEELGRILNGLRDKF